ncbi:YbfB/YjiJ family MFS transporter, partial [Teichococcus aerofrigidensis]
AAAGTVVSGVGGGVVLGALAVPALLPLGVSSIWLGLGLMSLLLWLPLRRYWPAPPAEEVAAGPGAVAPPRRWPGVTGLMVVYGLSAAGMVPPMIYLADLGMRGRGLGAAAVALLWALFGLGAMAGTLLGGRIAGRVGGMRTLALWMGVQALALGAALLPGGAA